jgi:hypothetical protein
VAVLRCSLDFFDRSNTDILLVTKIHVLFCKQNIFCTYKSLICVHSTFVVYFFYFNDMSILNINNLALKLVALDFSNGHC